MKTLFILLTIIILVLLGALGFWYEKNSSNNEVSPSPSLIPAPIASAQPNLTFCNPQDLETYIILDPAAGNIYGTFTIKNISGKDCQIKGDNYIQPNYDNQKIKNISISHQGQPISSYLTLSPNQILYSQSHYPNGPQCQGPTNSQAITFEYKISDENTVTFKDPDGRVSQNINTCESENDITEIQIWNISEKPINQ